MRKVFSRIVMLLIFAALLFPKSYAQIVGFYPEADTIFVGWGCTTPLIVCSLNPAPPAQDIINVTPDWNTWMWYNDALGIQNMVDFGYFLVDNPQNQFEYELWYIPEGWPLFPTAVPFDSVFMCEGYIANLQLKVLQNGVVIDSFSQPWVSVYGLPVEPEPLGSYLPRSLEIAQNYPNPFNASTQILVGLPQTGSIHLEIFNALGQRVYSEQSRTLSAGYHVFYWDGKSNAGRDISSGVYFCKISAGKQISTRKMVLLR